MPSPSVNDLHLLIHHHDPAVLTACSPPANSRLVCYDDLSIPNYFRDNKFADARMLLAMSMNPDEYIPSSGYLGLLAATFDLKFSRVGPLRDIPYKVAPFLSPSTVIAPLVCQDFISQAEQCHPTMTAPLLHVMSLSSLPRVHRWVPMASAFIAHVSVWRRFLVAWKQMLMDGVPFYSVCSWDHTTDLTRNRANQGPAYLIERFGAAWFSNQADLTVRPIINDSNEAYHCWEAYPGTTPIPVQSTKVWDEAIKLKREYPVATPRS